MSSNKTVKKGIRMTPETEQEIQNACEEQGIPDFSAFMHMAIRHLLRRFEEEKKYRNTDLTRIIEAWEDMVKKATQPIDPRQVAEEGGTYRKKDE